MRDALLADARFLHRLKYGTAGTTLRAMLLMVYSRGLWALLYQRCSARLLTLRSQGSRSIEVVWLYLFTKVAFWSTALLCKCELEGTTEIEPGVYLSNKGQLIIGARRIGSETVIHDRVTVGARPLTRGKPTIGRRVLIGANCVVYGDISIGDGATLLPNSVLSKSLPPGALAGGNPARIMRMGFANDQLRMSMDWNGVVDGSVHLPSGARQ